VLLRLFFFYWLWFLVQWRAWALKTTKRVGYCELHPSDKSWWIRVTSPWINHVCDKPTRVIVQLLRSYYAIVRLQDCLVLLLQSERLVISDLITQLLIRSRNLGRIIRHYSWGCLWEIAFGIQAWKCWTRGNRLISSRIHLKFEFIRYPSTRKAINLIELIHLTILYPKGTLWLRGSSSIEQLKSIWSHTYNLSVIAQICVRTNLKNIGKRNLFFLQERGWPSLQ
jgi:hypothetical protein